MADLVCFGELVAGGVAVGAALAAAAPGVPRSALGLLDVPGPHAPSVVTRAGEQSALRKDISIVPARLVFGGGRVPTDR